MQDKTQNRESDRPTVQTSAIPSRNRALVTIGLMLGMLITAMESTVVSTAMPTVIGDLHGIQLYPWVFSAYLLTSTTTVPIYGKLADLLGRRRVFLFATALFLLGSMLSGAAHSMPQLIAFRALQGLGAGGVLPLTLTIIGDLYTLEEPGARAGAPSPVCGAYPAWPAPCSARSSRSNSPGGGCSM